MGVDQIQAANGGMMVPPPKGSFINIPKIAQAQADYYNHPEAAQLSPYQHMQQLISQGVPSGIAAMVVRAQAEHAAKTPAGAGANYFNTGMAEMVASIQNSPNPTNVPSVALAHLTMKDGQPATPQAMIDNGYTFNQATQSWVLRGTQAAQGMLTTGAGTGSAEFMNTGFMQRYAAKGTPFLQQKRFYKGKFVPIGKLIRMGVLDLQGHMHRGKKKGRTQQVVQPVQATNAGGTPSTVLDLHLGSG